MQIITPISVGEYLDKLSILYLKKEYITEPTRLAQVEKEIDALEKIWPSEIKKDDSDFKELYNINRLLWNNSEMRKTKINSNELDLALLEIFRLESIINDDRFRAKKKINDRFNSELKEQKSYAWV